ncbi:MAG TPA: glutathione S-transferase family protein [Candidatus Acidoferrum sp.]|nr:glutathione S-transferase family protein [Candidatus Acidoferrum sp.]
MTQLTLVIGNKKYSSWSLRPWLLLSQFGVAFNEVRVGLFKPDTAATLQSWSPTGKVPVLIDGEVKVWDSLAIAEYANERLLGGKGWPASQPERALARAYAAEMHSGFTALRSQWPMNVCFRRQVPVTPSLAKDLARIETIWGECLARSGGPFLFGAFGIVDAMYAPVALRLHSYQPALSVTTARYIGALLELPALQAWIAAGRQETDVIDEDEYDWLNRPR